MLRAIRRLLPAAGTDVVYECRACGESLDPDVEACPACGASDVSRYEIE